MKSKHHQATSEGERTSTFAALLAIWREVKPEVRKFYNAAIEFVSVVFALAEILVCALLLSLDFVQRVLFGNHKKSYFFVVSERDFPVAANTVFSMKSKHRVASFSFAASIIGLFAATAVSAIGDRTGLSADAAERWAIIAEEGPKPLIVIDHTPDQDVNQAIADSLSISDVELVTDRIEVASPQDVAAAIVDVADEASESVSEALTESSTVEVFTGEDPVEEKVLPTSDYVYEQISHAEATEIIGRYIPWPLYSAAEKAVRTYDRHYADREDYAGCGITVEFLLATAYEESGGWWGRIAADGTMYPALINGSDARGPFQFTGEAWDQWYHDANGDGFRDPQNSYDSAGASMRYHCRLAVATYGGSLFDPVVAWNAAADYHDGPGRDREISAGCLDYTVSEGWCRGERYASRRLALYSELMGLDFSSMTSEEANSVVRQ